MSPDWMIIFLGFGFLIIFLLAHVLTSWTMDESNVLKSLVLSLAVSIGLQTFTIVLISTHLMNEGVLSFFQCALIWGCSTLITGLGAYFYVLWIFGPYETSIRIRLVREFFAAGRDGLSVDELLCRYNVHVMVKNRLNRLVASGDVECADGRYHLIKDQNMFFLIRRMGDRIASFTGAKRNG